jgi:hypothetical protein
VDDVDCLSAEGAAVFKDFQVSLCASADKGYVIVII